MLTTDKGVSMPLALLAIGEKAEVVKTFGPAASAGQSGCCNKGCGGKDGGQCRVEDMGLRAGKTVEMLNSGNGPLLVMVDGLRLAMGVGMAMKIMVRRIVE